MTDRGAQFRSSLWQGLGRLMGIKCTNMTAYHPQANGLVERLKASLMAREQSTNWMKHLLMALLGIRSAWRPELGGSPAELVFGTSLHLPGEFVEGTGNSFPDHDFLSRLKTQMNSLTPSQTVHHGTHSPYIPSSLDGATHVFVRRDARAPPLTRPYQGPFKVLTAGEFFFNLI